MTKPSQAPRILDPNALDALFLALHEDGRRVFGPRRGEGALVYGELQSAADLPQGWTEEQAPGRYRLKQREDNAFFGYTVPAMSWKQYLLPPRTPLVTARLTDDGIIYEDADPLSEKLAFVGVRPCELAAIGIQDRVFLEGTFVDTHYQRRREDLFIVVVQCAMAASTCFCTSMGTGPRASIPKAECNYNSNAESPRMPADRSQARDSVVPHDVSPCFDLAVTEILNENTHHFVVEVGTARGAAMLNQLDHVAATDQQWDAALAVSEATANSIVRRVNTQGLPALLMSQPDHPRLEDVAKRCLACTNCTMVCPTCFCTGVVDESSLDGQTAQRTRQWESCFTADFSYMHGGSVRRSTHSRYRQWLTHKLATWVEQFDTSGCVGCGRCITWCPVGIDLTEEVAVIRSEPSGPNMLAEHNPNDHASNLLPETR